MALEVSFGCSLEERAGVPLLQWASWLRDGVRHGITTRQGGLSRSPYDTLNLGMHVGDIPGAVQVNRAKLGAALGDMRRPQIYLNQVHGAHVVHVTEPPTPGSEPAEGDALITNRTDVFLVLLFADCVPVLFFDPLERAVGAAHGGWRGLAAGVLENTVQAMHDAFGTQPGRLQAAIGPHIGVCCYEVGAEVAETFSQVPRAIRRDESGQTFLNLARVVRARLTASGLDPENVSTSAACTSCFTDVYFSHRAEGTTGRIAAAIGLDALHG